VTTTIFHAVDDRDKIRNQLADPGRISMFWAVLMESEEHHPLA
jgi:hypothetical protein